MSERQWWPAPAKLNLFLHVLGRRADGLHDLQTIFQLIDLCDELAFEVTGDATVTRIDPTDGIRASADLCVRAARALQRAAGVRAGARIRLRKRIPIGAGLGGGSSDAATTLVALNKLWGTGFDQARLSAIGRELGADVPVFVAGRSSWAEGVGERLTPVELPLRWYLVLDPQIFVSTAEVFQSAELTRNSTPITMAGFLQTGGRNDCESVVRQRFRAVNDAILWLQANGAGNARLTGTGSCVFASFATAAEAERVAARVPDCWVARVARGLAESPLQAAMQT